MAAATRPSFSAIDNFRDFGGAPAAGGRVRPATLYRSGHHGRATEEDLEALDGLGLAAIIDLRRPEERAREPSRRAAAFQGVVIEDDHTGGGGDVYAAFIASNELTVASMRAFLLAYYRRIPFEPRILAVYRRYFAALAAGEGPVLVHCAAGKDRTGVLVALTHHLLEVDFAHTLADYLLTNDEARIAQRAPLYAAHIEEVSGRKPSLDGVRAALGVEADYLTEAFAAIAEGSGGTDAYLERRLGVTPDVRRVLLRRLVIRA